MYDKPVVIHLDGMDKTGKDTIRKNIITFSKGNALVHLRSYISQIAYSRLYFREIDEEWFFSRMRSLCHYGEKFVFLTVSNTNVIRARFEATNESDLPAADINIHNKVFNTVKTIAISKGVKILTVETDVETARTAALEILDFAYGWSEQ